MYRVLIIDDDKLARKGMISIVPWEQCGFVVAGDVANGALGLEFIEHNEVDLVVVDLVMPVLSGLDFIRECKLRHPDIRYVVLSSHESFDYVQEALRLGVLDYISKLRMDQEDCTAIFRCAAAKMDAQKSVRTEYNKSLLNGIYEELDTLMFIYHKEKLEELRVRAAAAGLNEPERYQIFYYIVRLISNRFDVQIQEDNYEENDAQLTWLIKVREQLLRAVKQEEIHSHIEGLILLAVLYISEHLTEHELLTETVAGEIHMSRSYFSTSFKKYTGYSVNGYIRKERVALAKRMIAENNRLSLAEVSYRAGYKDDKYFARVFQQIEGVTFPEYKKGLLNSIDS